MNPTRKHVDEYHGEWCGYVARWAFNCHQNPRLGDENNACGSFGFFGKVGGYFM
jgi:hypothetical protein